MSAAHSTNTTSRRLCLYSLEPRRCSACLRSSWQRTFRRGSIWETMHIIIIHSDHCRSYRCERSIEVNWGHKIFHNPKYWLEYGPVCRALAVETSPLVSGQNVPDDDGLWVLLRVHQGTEGHHIPGRRHNHRWSSRWVTFCFPSFIINKLSW